MDSKDRTINRLIRRYKPLLPIQTPITDQEKSLLHTTSLNSRLIIHQQDKMRSSILYSLLSTNKLLTIKVMSLYEMVSAYLDNTHLLDITPTILVVYGGYHEAPNKQLENLNLQVWENQKRLGHYVWFYWKGTINSLQAKYPAILSYIKSEQWPIIDLNKEVQEEVDDF